MMTENVSVFVLSLAPSVYFALGAQSGLATFQVLSSLVWPEVTGSQHRSGRA